MNNISSQVHNLNVAVAVKYGVDESILIHHFLHWIHFNKMREKNFKEGRTWTYQSRKDMAAHFPYWNEDRIRRLCENLVELGVLVQGNFNKNTIDRTLWYAFANEEEWGLDDTSIKEMFTKGKSAKWTGKSAKWTGKSAKCIIGSHNETDTKETDKHSPPSPQRGEEPSGSGERVDFGDFVWLRKEDLQQLISEHGEKYIMDLIEEMNDEVSSTGKRFNDYSATIRKWIRYRKRKSSKMPKNEISNHARTWYLEKLKPKLKTNLVNDSYIDFLEITMQNGSKIKVFYNEPNFKELLKHELQKAGILKR